MYRSILLVDDDADDQLLFHEAIHGIDSSIRLETADNGKHALNKLRSAILLPDLIFVDLNMPLVNGFEFISALKKEDALAHIPVVAFTTSTNPLDATRARRLGADAFLTKASSYPEQCKKLRRVVNTDFTDSTKALSENDYAF